MISAALNAAGLREFFDDPLFGGAVGFDRKAGVIADFVEEGGLGNLSANLLHHVMLVDDDLVELDNARSRGLQMFPALAAAGLQNSDFDVMFSLLGLWAYPEASCCSAQCDPTVHFFSLGGYFWYGWCTCLQK